jgi:hypothetical protein
MKNARNSPGFAALRLALAHRRAAQEPKRQLLKRDLRQRYA